MNRFSFSTIDNDKFASDSILESYIETALWCSVDDEGEPLDKNFDINNLSRESLKQAKKDLWAFIEMADTLLDGYALETVSHDFWLTRNRHGAGFWDGDYEESIGQALTEMAHGFGEINPIVGDDGLIYFE